MVREARRYLTLKKVIDADLLPPIETTFLNRIDGLGHECQPPNVVRHAAGYEHSSYNAGLELASCWNSRVDRTSRFEFPLEAS